MPEGEIAGIGISCGGPLDSRRGVILSPPNLPGWDEVPVKAYFERETGAPAMLRNDADACAVAEWRYGAGRGCRNMVFLTFGTGFGAGLILNGALYSGSCDMAGEIGHIRAPGDPAYRPVGYGKSGSFEGYCSGGGIAELGRAIALEAHPAGPAGLLLPHAAGAGGADRPGHRPGGGGRRPPGTGGLRLLRPAARRGAGPAGRPA